MNILITGGSGNLGQAVVEQFSAHQVIAITSPGKSSTVTTAKNIKAFEADLTDEQSVSTVLQIILQEFKTIDAAILLVGGYAYGGIETADGKSVKKMIDINFNTAYFTARPVFQQMLGQSDGGRIVLVGARPALDAKAGKHSVAYALSKSLIFSLADILNASAGDKNVVTSVIVPSTIDTPVNRTSMPDADFTKWIQPAEIAALINVVISEKSQALRQPVLKIYGKA